jgi:hypothetical protein
VTDEQQIETDLFRLLEIASTKFGYENLQQVREFIEHDECGLALETIAWMFIEARQPIPDDAKDIVKRASRLLKLEDSHPIIMTLAE